MAESSVNILPQMQVHWYLQHDHRVHGNDHRHHLMLPKGVRPEAPLHGLGGVWKRGL